MICYCCFFRIKTGTRAPVQRRFFVFDWSKICCHVSWCQLGIAWWSSRRVIHIQLSNTQSFKTQQWVMLTWSHEKEKKSGEKGFLIFALILEKIGYHYQMVTINSMTGKSPFACSAQECGKTNKEWGKMNKSILISTF